MVTVTFGNLVWSGKTEGAVNVAVEEVVVLVFWMLLRVPTAPLALSQVADAEGLGVGFEVVGFGVVVKSHLKSTETSVAPVTVAVIVCDWVGTITAAVPETVTTT